MVNNLICEKPLPLPLEVEENADGDFKDVAWNEYVFYTTSFFDIDIDIFSDSHYTITEDDQFYKEPEEGGVEKQEFTGEILFWTEVLGEEYDHSITFRALFYKGDLKELELENYGKKSNKERKEAVEEFSRRVKEKIKEEQSLRKKIFWPFKQIFSFIFAVIKWIMFRVFALMIRVEIWINK